MAPSSAMASAEGKSTRSVCSLSGSSGGSDQGASGSGGRRGMPSTRTPSITVWKRDPMVATSTP